MIRVVLEIKTYYGIERDPISVSMSKNNIGSLEADNNGMGNYQHQAMDCLVKIPA